MKNSILLVITVLFTSFSFGQNGSAPSNVRNKFNSKYANAQDLKWSQKEGNYEATFETDNLKKIVLLDSKGTVLKSESQMYIATLPVKILNFFKEKQPESETTGAKKIIDEKQIVTYVVTSTFNNEKNVFNEKGDFVKNE